MEIKENKAFIVNGIQLLNPIAIHPQTGQQLEIPERKYEVFLQITIGPGGNTLAQSPAIFCICGDSIKEICTKATEIISAGLEGFDKENSIVKPFTEGDVPPESPSLRIVK